MSTTGISSAVDHAVSDALAEMDAIWPFTSEQRAQGSTVDTPEMRVMVGAIVRAVLERLEAQGTAGGSSMQINE